MIILKATTETLQITTTTAAAIDYSVSYADITATTFAPSSNEGKITTATATSVLSAPASSTQRQITLITISNRDASLSDVISVQKLISSTAYNLTPNITLLPGEVIQYMDGQGWVYYSASGSIKGNQTAAGSNYEVQFNNNNLITSDPNLIWNSSTKVFALSGSSPTIAMNSLTADPIANGIPYVASTGAPANGSSSSLSVPVPAGVVAGDLIIIALGAEWNSTVLPDITSVSVPGFTVAQVAAFQSYATYTENSFLLYKYAAAADTGTYTVTFNTVGGGPIDVTAGAASIVRGGPTSGNPFTDTFQTSHSVGSTSLTIPSFTPAANNSLLFASIWCDDGIQVSTFPSGWTKQANATSGNGIMIATLQQTTAAATGSLTWTMASGSPDPVGLIGTIRSPMSSYALAANTVGFYARSTANYATPSVLDSTFVPMSLQSALYQRSYALWMPSIAAGVWTGTTAVPTGGTTAIVLPTLTNNYTAMRRSTFSSIVTTTNQKIGINTELMFFIGGATGQGGFFFSCRFGFDAIKTGMRAFIGLTASPTIVSANPSASANSIGFGFDLADTAFSFIHNDATGTATKETIPGQGTLATNNTGYDAYIWSPPNSSIVYYRLDRTDTGATLVDSSVTTDLPVAGTMMMATAQMSNGTANTAVGSAVLGVNRLYVETIR